MHTVLYYTILYYSNLYSAELPCLNHLSNVVATSDGYNKIYKYVNKVKY